MLSVFSNSLFCCSFYLALYFVISYLYRNCNAECRDIILNDDIRNNERNLNYNYKTSKQHTNKRCIPFIVSVRVCILIVYSITESTAYLFVDSTTIQEHSRKEWHFQKITNTIRHPSSLNIVLCLHLWPKGNHIFLSTKTWKHLASHFRFEVSFVWKNDKACKFFLFTFLSLQCSFMEERVSGFLNDYSTLGRWRLQRQLR